MHTIYDDTCILDNIMCTHIICSHFDILHVIYFRIYQNIFLKIKKKILKTINKILLDEHADRYSWYLAIFIAYRSSTFFFFFISFTLAFCK